MASNQDELTTKLKNEHALELLRAMQETASYKLIALTRQSLLSAAAKRVPWLSRFLQGVDDTGEAIFRIGDRVSSLQDSLQDTPGSQTMGHGFHFGMIGMAAFDFVRIPIIYLAAYMLNEKVPITLDNNARWLYSGILFALAIIALTVPAAAPVIGFVGAGMGFSVSVFLLGKILYERYQLGKENKKIKKIINIDEQKMLLIQQEAKDLEKRLKEATQEDEITKIHQEIALLQNRYESKYAELEELKNKELHIEQKMDQVGIMQVLDKGVGIFLSSLTIPGLVLALFFPALGLGILTGVAVTGGVYLAARLTAPLFVFLGNWLSNKVKRFPGGNLISESQVNENSLTDIKEKQHASSLGLNTSAVKGDVMAASTELSSDTKKSIKEQTFDSTTEVLVGLMGKKIPAEELQSEHEISPRKEEEPTRVTHLFTKPVPNSDSKEDDDEVDDEAVNVNRPLA